MLTIWWPSLLLENVYFTNIGMDNKVLCKGILWEILWWKKAHPDDLDYAEKADYEDRMQG